MRTRVLQVNPETPDPAVIHEAAELLCRGGLVAFPTETVYGLGASLDDPQAIQELYQVKRRPFEKQVTIHIADASAVHRHGVVVSPLARELMHRFWPGSLTLVLPRPDGSTVGFRLPRHPVALALIREAGVPLVAPSANLSGNPPPRTAAEVLRDFVDRIDAVLDGGQTPVGSSSTVLDLSGAAPRILRHGVLADQIEQAIVPGKVAS